MVELRWVMERGGWEVSLLGEKGKVSGILGNATFHGEARSLPILSTFGVPRTSNYST